MKTIGIVCACICALCFAILKVMERNRPKAKKRRQTANNDDAWKFFGAVGKILLWLLLVAVLLLILSWLGIGVLDTIGQIFSK